MTEENYRRWDIAVKIIAPLLTVAGILVGVWQFSREQANQLQRQHDQLLANDKLEFKRRIWEKQIEVYSKFSEVAGRIASYQYANDKNKLNKDISEFYSLYWGNMIYVKDDAVEQKMIEFNLEIQDFLKNESDKDRLKLRAHELIEACRKSSKESWFNE